MKIRRVHRIISATLAFTLLNEIMFPTISMALTSQDTQPEVWGYQPVDATDNVGLTSGAFNYTIPITSIPEYPMAIGYSSGIKMDQEASCFGLGFSGFSGAISRSLIGLPDDVNGAVKKYRYENQKRWDASVKGTLGTGQSIGAGISVGASVSMQIGYDNYKGVYGAVGTGLGLSTKLGKGIGNKLGSVAPALGGGVSLISDSRESGVRYGVGAAVGISYHLAYGGNGFESLKGWGKSFDSKGHSLGGPQPLSTSSSALSPLSYVLPNSSSLGISITVPLNPSLSVTASYNQTKAGDADIDKKAYGFMYLKDYNRRNYDHLADMTIEGEDSHNDIARNTPSYLQRDFFAVNAMGMSGSMQLFQKEYGVVSRNRNRSQNRQLLPLGVKTDRKEVYPWVNVTQAKLNKSVDILALLKKKDQPEDKDFDNVLFEEQEMASLTSNDKSYDSYPEFKMRGDLTGEFDLASKDFKDHEINTYDLLHISGVSEKPELMFLGMEKGMPLYQPNPTNATTSLFTATGDNHKIEKGTNITYHKIGDIIDKYKILISDNPGSGLSGTSNANAFNFNQSFYSHYEYKFTGNKANVAEAINSSNFSKINILEKMKTLADNATNGNVNSLIGSIDVQSANGLRYYFNLPVFNKTNVTKQLQGKEGFAPDNDNATPGQATDYVSFKEGSKIRNRGKATIDDKFIYPYAWLLTAIVGDDYIDFDNIPGPSDGDIGYWVKFKYVKVADAYRWRTPFTSMNHIPGAISANDDDIYSVNSGTKEIYYLEEVESANYICNYTMQGRLDGWDAKGLWNGNAYNSLSANLPAIPANPATPNIPADPTGLNPQFLVTQIDLYKKHDSGDNSKIRTFANASPIKGTLIKSTVFQYDYHLCPNVPNNFNTYHNPGTGINGKATLRKVQHKAYDENGTETYLPSYNFEYWDGIDATDPTFSYNPSYNKDMVDQWGNYYRKAKETGNNNSINYYTNYTELNKTEADKNAKVYSLSKITLPSGGSMNIDYQAQSYGFVEDKTPYVMRHISKVEASGNNTTLTVDISDLDDLVGTDRTNPLTKVLKQGDILYGEVAFYTNTTTAGGVKEKNIFTCNDTAIVVSITPVSDVDLTHQSIIVKSNNSVKAPFISKFQQYMYEESKEMRLFKESLTSPRCLGYTSSLSRYESMEKDGPLEAATKVVANVRNMFVGENIEGEFNTCFFGNDPFVGTPVIYAHWSYLRTPIYKAKYTGSSVKSIVLKDDFYYATKKDGTVNNTNSIIESDYTVRENEYGTNYYYDLNSDGTGVSAGVASIEPGGGKSCVLDVYDLQGAGFAPGPSIISSKTTVENLYAADVGETVSRKKGKTVYEFYTAKDDGLQFKSNFKAGIEDNGNGTSVGRFYMLGIFTFLQIKFKIFKRQISFRVPAIIPLLLTWDRFDKYHTKSYAYTDNTDIFGRPKSINQIDASGQDIGNQHFTYYGMDEPVTVYTGNPASDNFITSPVKKPGKMDQAWSEAYYTKSADINYMWLMLNAKTYRDYSYTSMKYSYIPSVLKEVSSTMDGLKTSTQNIGYDYFSGSPIEVKSKDSYGNTKVVRTVPAYWKYLQMGSSFNDPNNINNLTASSGTYMYLIPKGSVNQPVNGSPNPTIDNKYLLGAGVVAWENSNNNANWKLIDYLQPQQKYISSTECKYDYTLLTGDAVRHAYADNGEKPVNGNNIYIKRNSAVFKTYKGYTYDAPLEADGTFQDASFVSFNYSNVTPPVNPNRIRWKLLSTNQLYSTSGVLVQSKDVLGKYASQLLGCNYSNTIGAVSNGSWGASAYDGAENTYTSANGETFLEGNKFVKMDAKVVKVCVPGFTTYTLTPLIIAHIVKISVPPTLVYETPFAKIDVTYINKVQRSLYISLKTDGKYRIVSNAGEEFTGFYTYPESPGIVNLLFDPNVFDPNVINANILNPNFVSSFPQPDAIFPSHGFTVTTAVNKSFIECTTISAKTYDIPNNDCVTEAHTGNYVFALKGNSANNAAGTKFTIGSGTNINLDELTKKYKALVWVNNSSPAGTKLVVQIKRYDGSNKSEELFADKASPYAKEGNWSLLRLDFDLGALYSPKNGDYAEVFVRNTSSNGSAIYDDIRVLPYHADMTNWVFDPVFNRVISGLDNDNFASYSAYDSRGRTIESAVEIQNVGKKTVQKFIYNDQRPE